MSGAIYWIDDKKEGFPSDAVRARIAEKCNAKVVCIEAQRGTADRLQNYRIAGLSRELVILDYWLGNLPRLEGEEGKIEFGSNWAAVLRADHPDLPIVGVTSETISDIPEAHKSQFLYFFKREDISNELHDFDIKSLIDGFPTVHALWKASRNESAVNSRILEKALVNPSAIVGLLDPPEGTADYLQSVLPEFAKQPWDQETAHEFSRWVIEVLLGRPGFLFDALEAATFVGLTEEGFLQIGCHFDEAKYSGVFASDDRPRWWASMMRPVLIKIIGKSFDGPVREQRMKLLGIFGLDDAEFLSKCYAIEDSDKIPDCVAFDDESRHMIRRVQARIEDTEMDPLESPPPGFESRRIWRGIEK